MNNIVSKADYLEMIIKRLKNEKVFITALLLAVVSATVNTPKLSYINFKVLVLLFNLMAIVAALKKVKLMDIIAVEILSKCKNTRIVSLVFVIMTFFSAMLVTNDVALLTFAPLTILTFKVARIDCMKTVIIQTLAANIGSSLTPMGNPQNLFLFTHYNLKAAQFFYVIFPFVLSGMLWILYLNKRTPKRSLKITLEEVQIEDKKALIIYLILFTIVIGSVFGLVNYKYALAAVAIAIFIIDKKLFMHIDYFLIGTFICFFIFIGNVSNIAVLQNCLKNFLGLQHMTYLSAILFSQIISNVPCSILIAGFTDNWREVLLGVNIGGMGTLISSLASLISYKIYSKEVPSGKKEYLKKFNIYNFASLILFTIIFLLF